MKYEAVKISERTHELLMKIKRDEGVPNTYSMEKAIEMYYEKKYGKKNSN